ncbi:MAG: hypothetical protein ABF479_01235 [Gluconacetobacter sp.]
MSALPPDIWREPLPKIARALPDGGWGFCASAAPHVPCACCGTPHAPLLLGQARLCVACASVWSFSLPGYDERCAVIWLPYLSQSAINRMAWARLRYQLSHHLPYGINPPRSDGTEDPHRGDTVLGRLFQDAQDAVATRFGAVTPSDLMTAWRRLEPESHLEATALRLLPTGVWQNEVGRNIFTDLLGQ